MNKNSLPLGILFGLIAPVLFFIVFYAVIYLVVTLFGLQPFLPLNSLVLLSLAPNFILVRYFFNTKKLEHTGQGLIFITLGLVAMFFIFIHGKNLMHLPGLQW